MKMKHVKLFGTYYLRSIGLLVLYCVMNIFSTWGIWQLQELLDDQQRRALAWILSIIASLPFIIYCFYYSYKKGIPIIYYPDEAWAIVRSRFHVLRRRRVYFLIFMIFLSLVLGIITIVGPVFIDSQSYPFLGIMFLFPLIFYFCVMFLIVDFPE